MIFQAKVDDSLSKKVNWDLLCEKGKVSDEVFFKR